VADFAPELRDRDPQDYMKASRGWDDDIGQSLVSGLGNLFKLGVGVADDHNKRTIKEEIRTSVDEINNGTIDTLQVHAQVGTGRLRSDRTPAEMDRFVEEARRWQAGVNAGNVKETSYYAMLDSKARQMRARYPGYRDHIDGVMKEFTGVDPANTLIRELRQEAQAVLKSGPTAESRRLALLEKMDNPPVGADRMPYEQLIVYHTDTQRQKFALEHRKAQISTATAQKTFDTAEIGATASTEWGTQFRNMTQRTNSVFGLNMSRIEEMRERWAAQDPTTLRSPEETKKLVQLVDQVTTGMEGEFLKWASSSQPHLGGRSYGEVLGKDKLAEIKANQLDGITSLYRKFVTDNDFGALKQAAQLGDLYKDGDLAAAMTNPVLRSVRTLRAVAGDAGLGIIMSRDPVFLKNFQEGLKQHVLSRTMDPSAPATSGLEQIENARRIGEGMKPETVTAILDKQSKLISDPKALPADRKGKLIDSWYGTQNETFLGAVGGDPKFGSRPGDPQRVFNTMANPAIAKEIYRFSQEQGDMSHWDKYQNWVLKQTYALNLTDIGTVGTAMTNGPALEIKFNPTAFKFEYKDRVIPVPSGRVDSPGMAGLRIAANAIDGSGTSAAKAAIDRVNASFAPLRDVMSLNKTQDPSAFAFAAINQMVGQAESRYGKETVAQSVITELGRVLYDKTWDPSKQMKPGPYKAPADKPQTVSEPYDLTPVAAEKMGERLSQFGRWFTNMLPSRESIDRQRNEANRRGELR
jgi:hypothetical protein